MFRVIIFVCTKNFSNFSQVYSKFYIQKIAREYDLIRKLLILVPVLAYFSDKNSRT